MVEICYWEFISYFPKAIFYYEALSPSLFWSNHWKARISWISEEASFLLGRKLEEAIEMIECQRKKMGIFWNARKSRNLRT